MTRAAPLSRGHAAARVLYACAAVLSFWPQPFRAGAGPANALGRLRPGAQRSGVAGGQPAAPVHVAGNRLADRLGNRVILRGANRSGTEYACLGAVPGNGGQRTGGAFADGPVDGATLQAMRDWGMNAIRIPLNEDCWLGINGVAFGGTRDQDAVAGMVDAATAAGLYPILDLHWSAPGTITALGQQPMPDADHAPLFWRVVAMRFGSNDAVLFDLFNEPYLHGTTRDAQYRCLRDGCATQTSVNSSYPTPVTYQSTGTQQLVEIIRRAGARNVILVGGVDAAQSIAGYLGDDGTPGHSLPRDPLGNLAVSMHRYFADACGDERCWDREVAPVAARYPVIAGEVGDVDCTIDNSARALDWLDAQGISYLAWVYGTAFGCQSLIAEYGRRGVPTQPYGQWWRDHLRRLAGLPVAALSFAAALNNQGVAGDHARGACALDDQGQCYSARALAAAGIRPGVRIPFNSTGFAWSANGGGADNLFAAGQTIGVPPLPSATALDLLGSATHGPATGAIVLTYTDGVTRTGSLSFPDWASTGAPHPGEQRLVTTPYCNRADGATTAGSSALYAVAVPLDASRTLASYRLPALPAQVNGYPYFNTRMHIFSRCADARHTVNVAAVEAAAVRGGVPMRLPGTG